MVTKFVVPAVLCTVSWLADVHTHDTKHKLKEGRKEGRKESIDDEGIHRMNERINPCLKHETGYLNHVWRTTEVVLFSIYIYALFHIQ